MRRCHRLPFCFPLGRGIKVVLLVGILAALGSRPVLAQEEKSSSTPSLGVLEGSIKNELIYRVFLRAGKELNERDDVMTPAEISAALKKSNKRSDVVVPSVAPEDDSVYRNMARSSLLFGTVFDCGRCSELHASIAGGVVVSTSGLAITNHHVLDRAGNGTEEIFAVSFDGKSHPITKVLSADKIADVALVQLGGEGPFFPAPIAAEMPMPLEPVTILSHPKNQFFVLTQGVVSRHVQPGGRLRGEWTEVTADYAAGSSGSGVFNSRGEVVGLVSRNYPIIRPGVQRSKRIDIKENEIEQRKLQPPGGRRSQSFVEMVLRRCVTLNAIRARFAKEQAF
jgi:S1-C subfamily serine protease